MPKKVLIIQEKMIGDVLTTSILFEAIRQKHPNYKLDYLIQKHTTAVLEHNPHIDNLIISDKESNLKRLLRSEDYDVVIDVYSKPRTGLLSRKTQASQRIGYTKWFSPFTYTTSVKLKRQTESGIALALENRLRLLEPILDTVDYQLQPQIYLKQAEKDNIKKKLDYFDFEDTKPIYMLNVLGSSIEKTYPPAQFAKLIDFIIEKQPQAQLLFNYIPSQFDEAKEIYDACQPNTQERIRLDFYAESLRDFLVLTSFCTALIGNEGGAVNMAKALHVPTFSIFSPWINQQAWDIKKSSGLHEAVHLKSFYPELFSKKSKKRLKKKQADLYSKFKPELFTNTLEDFLAKVSD